MWLKKNLAIDQQELALIETEKKRCRYVLKLLFSITLSLATRNLAFRGSSQSLYEQDNGNYLKEVELLAEFDPVTERHKAKIKDEASRTHYLGQQSQNIVIETVSSHTVQTIVKKIQEAKYYAPQTSATRNNCHLLCALLNWCLRQTSKNTSLDICTWWKRQASICQMLFWKSWGNSAFPLTIAEDSPMIMEPIWRERDKECRPDCYNRIQGQSLSHVLHIRWIWSYQMLLSHLRMPQRCLPADIECECT